MKTTIPYTLSLMTAAAALLVSGTALAQDGGTDGGGGPAAAPCDPTTLECSRGAFPQKAESMDRLPGDIDSGWLPKCSSNPPHCDKKIQARAQIVFDPIKTGGPIYIVDMTKNTFVDARWPTKDNFVLTLPGGNKNDGKFSLAHTMTPEIGLYVNVPNIYKGELAYDSTTLINKLPGAAFNYKALGAGSFPPWGFDPVTVNVKGTDLDNSQLFSMTFHDIGKMVGTNFDDYLEGKFAFDATSDTDFTYQTTQVTLEASGVKQVINYAGGSAKLPIQDADELTFNGSTKGIIRYEGEVQLKFVIGITSIGGMSVNLSYPIDAYTVKYGNNNVPVVFKSTTVKVPLPNVYVDGTTLDFGKVQTGSRSDKKKKSISNDGKLGAKLEFISSDPHFKVVEAATQIDPQDSYDLEVFFQPTKPGAQEATITVKSNDPDTPETTFKVRGFGEGEPVAEPEDGGTGGSGGSPAQQGGDQQFDGSGNDGGCGCRTAGTGAGGSGTALFAMLGLAFAALRRRRQ